ncbi:MULTISPECIES: VOC family protein [Enterococcus]|uniref:VOC domain-containing protein n=1 Tax=Enterococcus sulfureus ATCC 49903 TaxID=1140003 RepID=S0NR83_9ENTE|nr:VOC family protein [Enterococcus sulfureus]EOT47582.1 hypothetical protein OMY_00956 [Enterococcus sulfureus ATCC 49903]EOT83997.1 hypothetical protein I573_01722 [Enterococcus sulfureus ATCC 49903]
MFSNILQLMLYVSDVETASRFWQSLGFLEVSRQDMEGTTIVELALNEASGVHFVLYDREFFMEHSPGVVTSTPSIMFTTEDIDTLYQNVLSTEVEVGDLIQLENQLVFNFADPDGNYFAVTSIEQ